jgi:MFS family permease
MLVNVAAGLFILPFFLFSPIAGQLADKYEKSMLIQHIKLLEIAIMLLGAGAFLLESPILLVGILFLMGAQSALKICSSRSPPCAETVSSDVT